MDYVRLSPVSAPGFSARGAGSRCLFALLVSGCSFPGSRDSSLAVVSCMTRFADLAWDVRAPQLLLALSSLTRSVNCIGISAGTTSHESASSSDLPI